MTEDKLVLIVDDEAFNRDIAARLVKKMGYHSEAYESGPALLKALENITPDLVLLDIHMPQMNGLEVLAEIRKTTEKAELPVLMITADSDPDSVVHAFEIGANDYVTKPINSKTLRSRIETHLQLSDATKQVKEFADGAERLVAECTIDLQRRNEDLGREIRLRMETEDQLLQQKLHAEQSNKAKSEFLAIMTHELKTPLNVTIGFAELIAKDNEGQIGPVQCREYADYIAKSSNQLLNIVEDILAMSSYDVGKLSLKEGHANLLESIERAISRTKPDPAEKNITVTIDCDEALQLACDTTKFERVLLNVISNAVKFSSPNSECQISARMLDNLQIEITVKDQGVGMRVDQLEEVMQPYRQRSKGLDRSYEGLGLGLPVAKAILDLHKADLKISSVKDEGTTVTITFPEDRTPIHIENNKLSGAIR